MKKALWITVSVLMVLVLVGCQAATPAPTAQPTAKVYTYKDMVVGFIQTGSEGGWRAANTASFKETAEQLGINLKFYDAQNKLENQISAFQQLHRRQGGERHRPRCARDDRLGRCAEGSQGRRQDRRPRRPPHRCAGRSVCHLHRLRLRRGRPQGRRGDVQAARRQRQEERRRAGRQRRLLGRQGPRPGFPREDGRVRHHDHHSPRPATGAPPRARPSWKPS